MYLIVTEKKEGAKQKWPSMTTVQQVEQVEPWRNTSIMNKDSKENLSKNYKIQKGVLILMILAIYE